MPDNAEAWPIGAENRIVEKLPDGSTVVLDTVTKTVHSINQAAAAAFEACRERQTVARLATAMQEILQSPVTEEMALEAVWELQRAGLIACSGSRPPEVAETSRRSVLKTAAAVAAPLVLSLTAAEQRAYALTGGSPPPPSINGDDSNTICSNVSNPQTLSIVGQNTHFKQGTSVVTFSLPWITVTNLTVTDATHLTVTVTTTLQSGSGSGTLNATVVTGSETVQGINVFYYDNICD